MKAIITSIGEPTTELCRWALERNGFYVEMIEDSSSLATKLKKCYELDEDFLRVDADIIVNKNMTPELLNTLSNDIWWWQFRTFDWFKQDVNHSMAFIRKIALPHLRNNIGRFLDNIRPETEVSRIEELHNPRRMQTYEEEIMGLHGYGIKDLKPVIKLKSHRGQSHLYDFDLAMRLNEL